MNMIVVHIVVHMSDPGHLTQGPHDLLTCCENVIETQLARRRAKRLDQLQVPRPCFFLPHAASPRPSSLSVQQSMLGPRLSLPAVDEANQNEALAARDGYAFMPHSSEEKDWPRDVEREGGWELVSQVWKKVCVREVRI